MNRPLEKKLLALIGRTVAEHSMIRDGDHVAVAVSGGKDSLTLLDFLIKLRDRAPICFALSSFTVEQGKFVRPVAQIEAHIHRKGVKWLYFHDRPSIKLVTNGVEHGCELCSRYRRRAVYEAARQLGANVVALGHTADDFVEALLRNILFTGRPKPLLPVAFSSDREFRLIRPLANVREEYIRNYAQQHSFPIIPCGCSFKANTVRTQVRGFIERLQKDNPHVMSNVLSASESIRALNQCRRQEEAMEPEVGVALA